MEKGSLTVGMEAYARFPELCAQAPPVVTAIRQSAEPFLQTFG